MPERRRAGETLDHVPRVDDVLAVHQRQALRYSPRPDLRRQRQRQRVHPLRGLPADERPLRPRHFTVRRMLLAPKRRLVPAERHAEEVPPQRRQHRHVQLQSLFLPGADVVRLHRLRALPGEHDRRHVPAGSSAARQLPRRLTRNRRHRLGGEPRGPDEVHRYGSSERKCSQHWTARNPGRALVSLLIDRRQAAGPPDSSSIRHVD